MLRDKYSILTLFSHSFVSGMAMYIIFWKNNVK